MLLAAIAAMLAAGLAAALLIPGDLDRQAIAQEAGSLLAPTADASFTDAFGAPSTPTSAIAGPIDPNGPSGGGAPSPEAPGNTPPPNPAPEEPPDDEGILGFLQDLPAPPPPPLLGSVGPHRDAWGLR